MPDSPITVHDASDGGVAGSHPQPPDAQLRVGPSTAAEQNLVSAALIPVGCWRVDDVRFDFDSSFVLPAVAEEIEALAALRELHKKPVAPRLNPSLPQFIFPPMSIFGHADPVGDDDYNKKLSGRRAAAIYGLLTRRTDIWEDLFKNQGQFAAPVPGDRWGDNAIEIMQDTTGLPEGTARPTLFRAYMDALCTLKGPDGKPRTDAQGNPVQLVLDPVDDFLARHKDSLGKGDFQGCSEFNPLLIFSQQKNDTFEKDKDKTARNSANAPNRRVLVLLFRPGSKVLATKWPCPRAKEGVSGCKKRFWSDGEQRRSRRESDADRKFEQTHDTFACRFYHRLVASSPCERITRTFSIRLYNPMRRFIPLAPCEVTLGERAPFTDKADASGVLVLKDVLVPTPCTIRWGFPPEKDEPPELIFTLDVFLDIGDEDKEDKEDNKDKDKDAASGPNDEAREKLNNLGYCSADLAFNVRSFQLDFGTLASPRLAVTGSLDDKTLDLLRKVYREHQDDLLHPSRPSAS